ncbi:MAG: tRNA (adenosine(37)-N6)-dimethylallyltransferase MiaA [Muribaculaceae bacterium]|nr:tRNA (adenosine(37)-N6)-dimethylallyltransferase MiaA [Muribaculaceae bacterium]
MKELIVIAGPTASGKTALAIELARRLGCEIISADSRQVFRGIPIGTASPTPEELSRAPHHMVGFLELDAYYSAAEFESDVMRLLPDLFARNDRAILCGGSMMYVDAVCRGIDELPTITETVRSACLEIYHREGLDGVTRRLRELDPDYLLTADLRNPRRMVHALEICLESGRPYSTLRTGTAKKRPFAIRKFALVPERQEMFARINRRVELMMEQGLLEEARRVYPLRHLNSLNTVGYKELFKYFDGDWDLPTAIARIQKNTRVFAKKQLTWLKKSDDYTIITSPADIATIESHLLGR